MRQITNSPHLFAMMLAMFIALAFYSNYYAADMIEKGHTPQQVHEVNELVYRLTADDFITELERYHQQGGE